MRKLHVLMRKEELSPDRLRGKAVVVIDVLFATSTIVTAFEHGVRDVVPAADPDAARAAAQGLADEDVVLAGEHNMAPIPGFASYAPLALARERLAGRRLVYSTTNGTVALWSAREADRVYAGTLLNGAAVARHLARHCQSETVLLVCAGSGGAFNLEDFFGAGFIAECLLAEHADVFEASDAALAARATYRAGADAPLDLLAASRLGRLIRRGRSTAELEFVARPGVYDVVPLLEGNCLVRAGGAPG